MIKKHRDKALDKSIDKVLDSTTTNISKRITIIDFYKSTLPTKSLEAQLKYIVKKYKPLDTVVVC